MGMTFKDRMINRFTGIALGCGVVLAAHASFAQTERVRALVGRYLLASQKRDYAALARLTEHFTIKESQIKEENPRSLWPSLLQEFWKRQADDLQHKELKPSYISGIDRPFFNEDGDQVIHETRELLALMSPSARWTIAEVRPRPRRPLSSVYYLDVYVSVLYPSVDTAPRVGGGKVLKKMILDCTATGPLLDSVKGCSRLEKGDVYWPESQ